MTDEDGALMDWYLAGKT